MKLWLTFWESICHGNNRRLERGRSFVAKQCGLIRRWFSLLEMMLAIVIIGASVELVVSPDAHRTPLWESVRPSQVDAWRHLATSSPNLHGQSCADRSWRKCRGFVTLVASQIIGQAHLDQLARATTARHSGPNPVNGARRIARWSAGQCDEAHSRHRCSSHSPPRAEVAGSVCASPASSCPAEIASPALSRILDQAVWARLAGGHLFSITWEAPEIETVCLAGLP